MKENLTPEELMETTNDAVEATETTESEVLENDTPETEVLENDTPEVTALAKKTSVNPILIVLSIFFPIIGIVLFFVKKKENKGIAKKYLITALVGILIGCIIVGATFALEHIAQKRYEEEMAQKEGQFITTDDGEAAIVVDGVPVIIQGIDDGEEDFDKNDYDVVLTSPSIEEAVSEIEEEAKNSSDKEITEIK
jgi:hypothetical protein